MHHNRRYSTISVRARIYASLLDVDSIAPLDCTFDGKVVSKRQGGCGILSIRDTWQNLDKAPWFLILKVHLKLFIIVMSLMLLGHGQLWVQLLNY